MHETMYFYLSRRLSLYLKYNKTHANTFLMQSELHYISVKKCVYVFVGHFQYFMVLVMLLLRQNQKKKKMISRLYKMFSHKKNCRNIEVSFINKISWLYVDLYGLSWYQIIMFNVQSKQHWSIKSIPIGK